MRYFLWFCVSSVGCASTLGARKAEVEALVRPEQHDPFGKAHEQLVWELVSEVPLFEGLDGERETIGRLVLLGMLAEDSVAATYRGMASHQASAAAGLPLASADEDWLMQHLSKEELIRDVMNAGALWGQCSLAGAAWRLAAARCEEGSLRSRMCRQAREAVERLAPDEDLLWAEVQLQYASMDGRPSGICGSSMFQSGQRLREGDHANAARSLRNKLRSPCARALDW